MMQYWHLIKIYYEMVQHWHLINKYQEIGLEGIVKTIL